MPVVEQGTSIDYLNSLIKSAITYASYNVEPNTLLPSCVHWLGTFILIVMNKESLIHMIVDQAQPCKENNVIITFTLDPLYKNKLLNVKLMMLFFILTEAKRSGKIFRILRTIL